MKIGITGANGFIGKALVKKGAIPILADVTNSEEIRKEIADKKPDVILHLAAKSDPEFCEDRKNEKIIIDINLRGTYNVMLRASECGIPCVLMSTGQIWRGGFWERDHSEDYSKSLPVNQYGISKLAAEAIVKELFFDLGGKIVRSSSVFDYERLKPKIDTLKRGETLSEPVFIRRSFIYLYDFAKLLMEYCERIKEMPTVLHLAGSETVSHHELMREVARQYLLDTGLVEARRKENNGYAPRPGNGGLNTHLARSLGFSIPNYKDGIRRMRDER